VRGGADVLSEGDSRALEEAFHGGRTRVEHTRDLFEGESQHVMKD
jgi:hypothetical protein